MSRARHKMKSCKADGGRIDMKVSGNPDVFKEADERKKGGRAKKKKHVHMEGHKGKHRMDRPGRKTGGRVGADKAPLSSAHRATSTGERADGQPD